MWKSTVGVNAGTVRPLDDDDDWETDPDYVNNVTEEEQRWGGARDTGTIE